MAEFEPIPEEILQSRRSSREMAERASGHKEQSSSSGNKTKSRHSKRPKSTSGGDGLHHNKSVGSKSSKSAVSSEPLISDLDPPPPPMSSNTAHQGNMNKKRNSMG